MTIVTFFLFFGQPMYLVTKIPPPPVIVIEKEVVRHVDPPLGNIPHVARL